MEKIVAERAAWIEEMLRGVRALPLESYEQFIGDPRNVAAADSYVRRALEAVMAWVRAHPELVDRSL